MGSNTQKKLLSILIILLSIAITYVVFGSLFQYIIQTWEIDPFYQHGPWVAGVSFLLYARFLYRVPKAELLILDRGRMSVACILFIAAA